MMNSVFIDIFAKFLALFNLLTHVTPDADAQYFVHLFVYL
jgi:hypothetical protein